MKPPKVSVVTSAYNSEKFIARTIESVLHQTYGDFEFILVDDCSKDCTLEIIESYARRDSRIIPIHNEKNLGVVGGLNRGLEAVRGEYIARQDGDDISLPERFAQQVGFLDRNPEYGLVGSRVIYIDADDSPMNFPNPFMPTENEEIQRKLLDNNYLCGPAVMIRRTSLDKAGFWFAEGLDASEDYDIHLRLAEVSKLAAIAEPLYLYRQHPQSATNTQEYKQVLHKAIALERAIRRRLGEQAPLDQFSVVARDYLWAAVLAYSQKNFDDARRMLDQAIRFDPDIFTRPDLLDRFIRYRLPESHGRALEYVETLFGQFLPKTPQLKHVCSLLISSIHMKEFFRQAEQGERGNLKDHLWSGIRHDPRWLFNRGVYKLAMRRLLGR